jgi:hypothetical protein
MDTFNLPQVDGSWPGARLWSLKKAPKEMLYKRLLYIHRFLKTMLMNVNRWAIERARFPLPQPPIYIG